MNRDISSAIALLKSGKVVIPATRPLTNAEMDKVKRNSVMKRFRSKKLDTGIQTVNDSRP